MPTLVDHIMAPEDQGIPRIPWITTISVVEEWADGEITQAQAESYLGLEAGDTDLDWLKTKYQASTDKPKFLRVLENVLSLAERKIHYTTKARIVARINGLS